MEITGVEYIFISNVEISIVEKNLWIWLKIYEKIL